MKEIVEEYGAMVVVCIFAIAIVMCSGEILDFISTNL